MRKVKLAVIIPRNMYLAYNKDYGYCAKLLLEPFMKEYVDDVTEVVLWDFYELKDSKITLAEYIKERGLYYETLYDIKYLVKQPKYLTTLIDLEQVVKIYKTKVKKYIYVVNFQKGRLVKDNHSKFDFILRNYRIEWAKGRMLHLEPFDYMMLYDIELVDDLGFNIDMSQNLLDSL